MSEEIYLKVRNDITYGNLSPNQRLIEAELAKQYKVSRIPIREALHQLASEGLLTVNGNRKKIIKVSRLSVKEVAEIYDIRILLESYGTKLFSKKATQKDVKYLENLSKKLAKAAKDYNLKKWIYHNTLFHDYLVDNCGNGNLILALDVLKRRIYRYKYMVLTVPGYFESYLKDHEGIIISCKKNNGRLAEKYMKHHLQTIKKALTNFLNILPSA